MWHYLLLGILLGWGVAIPIGPMNLETIRRNLRFGTLHGIMLGIGVCSADVTYLILLSAGAFVILTHVVVLRVVSFVGALILGWFGINALRMKVKDSLSQQTSAPKPVLWRQYLAGYLMTLISPFTILFWASISSQVAALAHHGVLSGVALALGVTVGTISWSVSLNTALHFTKHRLSDRAIHLLNYIGGLLLIGFSLFGLWHAFHIH